MRVLLTGASGRLGFETCRHLAARGHEVVAVDSIYRRGLPVALKVVDLLDRNSVYPLLDGCEAVVHLANHADMGRLAPPQRLYAENLTMNANVFHAAVELGVRSLVFSSSIQAISGERDSWNGTGDRPSCLPYLPLDEHVPACPGNLYAASKANTEQLLRQYTVVDPALSCTAIRFPSIWNPEWNSSYFRHHRGMGPGRLDEVFSYLHVEDAAELIDRVLEARRPGYLHFVPAARRNRLGWSPAEVIERFYPGVPLKIPADRMTALTDLELPERLYGWSPKHEMDAPRMEG